MSAAATRPESTAVAKPAEPRHPIIAMLEQRRDRIEPFLPEGVSLARVGAAAILAIKHEPKLAKCHPESVVLAVAKIQQWGLEIGVTAHLVPFGETCTPVADYKGLCELMYSSGYVRDVDPQCVYEGDHFEYVQGLDMRLEHRPAGVVAKRGKLLGAYAIVRLPFGIVKALYMPIEEIDAIRLKYSKQWRQGPCPPWYAKKTVIRQVAKTLPKNPRLAKVMLAIQQDAEEEYETHDDGDQSLLGAGTAPRSSQHRELPAARSGEEAVGGDDDDAREYQLRREPGEEPDDDEYQDDRDLDELPLGDTKAKRRSPQSEGR